MKRSLLLVAALAGVLIAVASHRSGVAPYDIDPSAPLLTWVDQQTRPVLYANHPAPSDSISDAEALRHVQRLYRLQANLLDAQADGRETEVTHLLDTAMRALRTLVQRPGMAERPRFQLAFRMLTAEYEERYGVPDTLDLPRGEIYAMRQGLFATLNDDDTAHIEDVLASDMRLTDTEVPMTINTRVRESMAFLLRYKKKYLYPWLRRSSTYFPMIEHILAEENVPDELKYLALVESGLDPHAHSHARAGGIWQFVVDTGRRYGLTVDPWIDERRDPEKATRAAARHLRDLHALFGDWHLALAGYNCSPSVIKRAIRRARYRVDHEPTFWDVYEDLPEETRNYVPLFIATSIIISNPAAFDLRRVAPGPRYAFDHVPVQASLSLERVATLAKADLETLRVLNPELRGDRLPLSKEPYYVRIPYGRYEVFAENYAKLPKAERQTVIEHAVRPGETVGRIAERYHVDRPSLLAANDARPTDVRAGRRLVVPAVHYVGNAEIADDAGAKPIRVRYGSRATRPLIDSHSDTPGIAATGATPATHP